MSDTPRGGLGPRGRKWLEDDYWRAYRATEVSEARGPRIAGPREFHLEAQRPIENVVEEYADQIPRKDAIAFVRGWELILGDLETPFPVVGSFGELDAEQSISDVAQIKWFPTDQIMEKAFGAEWYYRMRHGQVEKEIEKIREGVRDWIRTVVETLP
jgi:hypothetical protein